VIDCMAKLVSRTSTVASVVNQFYLRRSSLSHRASAFVELILQHVATIDVLRQNFLSPEFETKFQREISKFHYRLTQCTEYVEGSLLAKNPARYVQ